MGTGKSLLQKGESQSNRYQGKGRNRCLKEGRSVGTGVGVVENGQVLEVGGNNGKGLKRRYITELKTIGKADWLNRSKAGSEKGSNLGGKG